MSFTDLYENTFRQFCVDLLFLFWCHMCMKVQEYLSESKARNGGTRATMPAVQTAGGVQEGRH